MSQVFVPWYACYFELRRLASIQRFKTATATLVSAFVLSTTVLSRNVLLRINASLFGSTHEVTSTLQRTQKYAVRVILRIPKSAKISPHLK